MSTSGSPRGRSNGSALPATFEERAEKATTSSLRDQMIGSMARAIDGLRDEMRDNTENMDLLSRMVRKIADKLEVDV